MLDHEALYPGSVLRLQECSCAPLSYASDSGVARDLSTGNQSQGAKRPSGRRMSHGRKIFEICVSKQHFLNIECHYYG